MRGLEGEVREGLRGGVDQGDEPRSVRPRLISAEGFSFRAFCRTQTLVEAMNKTSGRFFKQLERPPLRQVTLLEARPSIARLARSLCSQQIGDRQRDDLGGGAQVIEAQVLVSVV